MNFIEEISKSFLKPIFHLWSKAKLPQLEGEVKLNGISGSVEIIRDKWGIPHIYAANLKEVLFAQGFVHAQDRLWQMEITRRVARGKLSEFIGKDALEVDRLSRTLGFERVARQDFLLYNEEQKQLVQHYCDGVNAYLNHSNYKNPVEFTLTKLKPSQWEIIDVLAFTRLLNAQMTWGWYDEIVRAKSIELLGQEIFSELDNTYLQKTITLPDGIEYHPIDLDSKFQTPNNFMPNISGSNAWTVSGSKTDTGKPYLCNDPHLAITNPNIWYEIHLHCPELKVAGVSVPGLPLVPIGHNEKIGWGITLAFIDLEDVVIEKFTDASFKQYHYKEELLNTEFVEEKIVIKGENQPYIEKVMLTKHGVIVSNVIKHQEHHLALQSMALTPSVALWGWYGINTAQNWDDFKNGISFMDAPGLNIVYGDVEGNIGYYCSGKMPVKTKNQSSVPMPGWTGEGDWTNFVPFNEMPHVLNPKKGYVVSCNNKIEPKNFPHFMGEIYMNGFRAEQLEQRVNAKEKLGLNDFKSMQMDVTSIAGQALAKHYVAIQFDSEKLNEIKNLLVNWDGKLTIDSVGGCLYKVVKQKLVRRLYHAIIKDDSLIEELLGKGYHRGLSASNTFLGHNTSNLLLILEKNEASLCLQKYGGKQLLLKDGLMDAVTFLEEKLGKSPQQWQWGKLHQMEIPHALSVQKPLDKIFGLGPFTIPGDTDTPLQTYPVDADGFDGEIVTASYRQIIDFSNFDNCISSTPGGQSGHLASEFYASHLRDWMAGKYHPMCWSRKMVEANGKYVLTISKK
jgi:penicillin amidase